MKERYPLLFIWKEEGLGPLPPFPTDFWLKQLKQKVKQKKESFKKGLIKSMASGVFTRFMQGAEEFIEDYSTQVEEAYLQIIGERMEEIIIQLHIDYGKLCLKAIERVRFGEDRETVLRDIGGCILPETRGGSTTFTIGIKRILKTIHIELKSCIKKVRQENELACRRTIDSDMVYLTVPHIKQKTSWVEEVLTDEEISLLLSGTPASEIAWRIIGDRVKVSPRTLRNNLKGILPLL